MAVSLVKEYEDTAVLSLTPGDGFVNSPAIQGLTDWALAYSAVGLPVHLRGPAGTGKTTLALHIASKLGRPVMYITGDEEFGTSDLVGGQYGFRRRKVIDNFISSVLKTEDDVVQRWVDNRLTTACRDGLTLVYDEFSRSRPEANNVLLSVLEEGILPLPAMAGTDGYLKVHPDFRAIFTSNPQEYAGVHQTQDALLDRMVILDLEGFDEETEVAITASRSGLSRVDAHAVVRLVRAIREDRRVGLRPTVRTAVAIAKVTKHRKARASANDKIFCQACMDVIGSRLTTNGSSAEGGRQNRQEVENLIMAAVRKHCPALKD